MDAFPDWVSPRRYPALAGVKSLVGCGWVGPWVTLAALASQGDSEAQGLLSKGLFVMGDSDWLGVVDVLTPKRWEGGWTLELPTWVEGAYAVTDRDSLARLRSLLGFRVGGEVLEGISQAEAAYDGDLKDIILHSLTLPNEGALDPDVRVDLYPSLKFAATIAGPPGWWRDAAVALWDTFGPKSDS